MIASIATGLALALAIAVFVVGLGAPRTRRLSIVGALLAGTAVAFAVFETTRHGGVHVPGIAAGLTAIALGIAHGVGFLLVPLGPGRSSWRLVLVPLGMWCGSFASIGLFYGTAPVAVRIPAIVLGVPTLAAWLALPVLARRRTHVAVGGRDVPCVRFACPRCGTRVDFARGIAPCTDCGLFVRVDWPAPADAGAPSTPGGGVRLACPSCGARARRPRGVSACGACGTTLALHWNEHATAPDRGRRDGPPPIA